MSILISASEFYGSMTCALVYAARKKLLVKANEAVKKLYGEKAHAHA